MKTWHKISLGVLGVILYSMFLLNFTSSTSGGIGLKSNDPDLVRFVENYEVLKENWYYFDDSKKVLDAATTAMVSTNADMDGYTMYIPSDEVNDYFDQMKSEYVGIGIRYIVNDSKPMIVEVFNDSPAFNAGLQVGDFLIKADGKSLIGDDINKTSELVLGAENTDVTITYERDGKQKDVKITRKKLESSVNYSIKDKKGYLHIEQFTETTGAEAKKVLEIFKSKKITEVILDLRGNGGGYLTSVLEVADLFLPADKIVLITKDKEGKTEELKTTDNTVYDFDLKLLVDNGTASASEVLTAALNELLDVPIYGETTYGKGIVQAHYEYNDGAVLKFTSSEWLTPKGEAIHKKGIKPTNPIEKNEVKKALDLSYKSDKDIVNDSVNANLVSYQKALKALGYSIDRIDGYYSSKTNEAIEKFKSDYNLSGEKDLSKKVQSSIISQLYIKSVDKTLDNVLNSVY